jgi:hypothetical protein
LRGEIPALKVECFLLNFEGAWLADLS